MESDIVKKLKKYVIWQRDSEKTDIIFPIEMVDLLYEQEEHVAAISRYYKDDLFKECPSLIIKFRGFIFNYLILKDIEIFFTECNINRKDPYNHFSLYLNNKQIKSFPNLEYIHDIFIEYDFSILKNKNITITFPDKLNNYESKLNSKIWLSYKTKIIYLSVFYKNPKMPVFPYYFIKSSYVIFLEEDKNLLNLIKNEFNNIDNK